MPLVRLEVRNEYGLGDPDLYKAAEKDEPKALLEGVAVAGLVGVLRQLGDLAEFAAEIFHDLHDQVMATAARGQDMMMRVKHLEAGLPSVEKAALAQTNHIHFAYTAGSDWHTSIRTEQNHLSRGDMPGFIMDAYEECRGPPRLFLLDKFDAAGAGACLKRYSDPSFFKMEWATSELMKAEKVKREKKTTKSKRKSRRQRSGEVLDSSLSRSYSRMFYTLDFDEQNHSGEDMATYDTRSKFKKGSRSQSFTSGTKISYMEHLIVNPTSGHRKKGENALTLLSNVGNFEISGDLHLPKSDIENKVLHGSQHRLSNPDPLPVTWDEKTEVQKPATYSGLNGLKDESKAAVDRQAGIPNFNLEEGLLVNGNVEQYELLVRDEKKPESCGGESQNTDVASEGDNYVDALNTIESEVETDSEGRMKQEVQFQKSFHELEVKSGINKQEIPPCHFDQSDVKELPPCTSDHSDVEEFPPGTSGHSDEVEVPPCSSGHSDVETSTVPPSLPDKELLEDLSEGGLPDSNVPGIPVFDVFENEDYTARDVEMTKETISNSTVDEHAAAPALSDKQMESSNIAVTDSCISTESTLVKLPQAAFNFWTNGGLLGLQPSKPPDFSATTKEPEARYEAPPYESRAVTHSDLSNENNKVLQPSKPPDFSATTKAPEARYEAPLYVSRAVTFSDLSNDNKGLQPSKPPDFSATTKPPEARYEASLYESGAVTHSDLSNENNTQPSNGNRYIMEKPQKPKTERELNVLSQKATPGSELSRLPEHMNHADVPGVHFDELVQKQTYTTDSNSVKFENHHLQQHDGFFEKTSRSFAAGESSVKFEEYNNVKGMKLEKENILCSRNDLPLLSSREVQSIVSISSDHVNGFQTEPLVDQLEQFDRSRGNTGSKLSDRYTPVDTTAEMPKKQKDEKIGQLPHMKISPKPTFIEETSYERGSPRHSGSPNSHWSNCSSPPLEHMKISFHPMNDLEGSMLKLDNEPIVPLRESDQKGSIREFRFLSFMRNNSQSMPLVEESIMSRQVDSEIDSDDDTFCKPSLNFSEDMFSQDSESNSEHWEQNGVNGRKDDLYDGLRRIPSAASISSFAGIDETNGNQADLDSQYEIHDNGSRSRKSSAAKSVGHATSSFQFSQGQLQEKEDSGQKEPFLVPVPPLQQPQSMHIKSPASSVIGQETCQLVCVSQPLGVPVLEAVDPCQSKPTVSVESGASHDKGKVKQATSLNRSTSIPQPDERDSFLEQIRAKSFNLKRTIASRPNFSSPRPTTNVNVAAILEKANAIRQVQ
ncbi:SCAR-like protein 2 [Nymphaea thermarum]|nr:SCAR-like protein 2 [Nymphaea thermarum]